MELHVGLEGFPELLKKFKALSGREQKAALGRGLQAAALYLKEQFKIGAPVDTGFMRNAIYVRAVDYSGYAKAVASASHCHYSQKFKRGVTHAAADMLPESRPPRGPDEVHVVFGARYTAPVEARKPFIKTAFNASKDTAADVARKHIQAFIEGA